MVRARVSEYRRVFTPVSNGSSDEYCRLLDYRLKRRLMECHHLAFDWDSEQGTARAAAPQPREPSHSPQRSPGKSTYPRSKETSPQRRSRPAGVSELDLDGNIRRMYISDDEDQELEETHYRTQGVQTPHDEEYVRDSYPLEIDSPRTRVLREQGVQTPHDEEVVRHRPRIVLREQSVQTPRDEIPSRRHARRHNQGAQTQMEDNDQSVQAPRNEIPSRRPVRRHNQGAQTPRQMEYFNDQVSTDSGSESDDDAEFTSPPPPRSGRGRAVRRVSRPPRVRSTPPPHQRSPARHSRPAPGRRSQVARPRTDRPLAPPRAGKAHTEPLASELTDYTNLAARPKFFSYGLKTATHRTYNAQCMGNVAPTAVRASRLRKLSRERVPERAKTAVINSKVGLRARQFNEVMDEDTKRWSTEYSRSYVPAKAATYSKSLHNVASRPPHEEDARDRFENNLRRSHSEFVRI